MKTTPAILRAIAAATSATSAVAAYPAAADMFGAVPGGVIVSATAATIYAGWHYVGTAKAETETDYLKIAGAGLIASGFAVAMVLGIHASAGLDTGKTATAAAAEADKLYQQQEAARINTLASITEELRVTSKNNNPGEYQRLQDQVDKLSTPTVRQASATQISSGLERGGWRPWVSAGVFEVITPALLLLAGMFARRVTPATPGQPVQAAPGELGLTPELTLKEPLNQKLVNSGVTHEVTPVNPNTTPTATQGQLTDNPLTALATRQVNPDAEGNITAHAITTLTGCTLKQARAAMTDAVRQNVLEKTGKGGGTRYRYATKLRAVK